MRVFSRAVPTTPKSIPDLIGQSLTQASGLGLQAPEANANNIFLGDKNVQTIELRPQANAFLPINSIRDVYIVGTSGDLINVVIF